MTPWTISDEDLLKYNALGLIPGPGETEEAFLARVHHCLEELPSPHSQGNPFFPGALMAKLPSILDEDPFPLTEHLFDIKPLWVEGLISNEKLAPWHGGCAWIYNEYPEAPTSVFIQLREKAPLFYRQQEIIAHELAHVGRMEFQEPRFEELIAYQTSSSHWRRWLGPIVDSGFESFSFLALIGGIFAFDIFLLATDQLEVFVLAAWLKLLPLAVIVLALCRVASRHIVFNRASDHISKAIEDPSLASCVLYRLTDSEIQKFSQMSPSAIKAYATSQNHQELRWRMIYKAYIEKNYYHR